ncbi:MAG: SMC family ATPase [Synechococcales cyanobacterium K44_A2020_017]|nr:SMC family ATPase [Synechococcales cyanobacterium K32_A2020_035]MBF2093399.1 SMC family ATPase [Synechococcales cyanobacterium K44_A2020_017]
MIPQSLKLRNFLSYRQATLDFRGLHVACICGANGAGKSSLLEAIAWAVWGQGRAASDDDVIYQGALEAQVDYTFRYREQVYRIIRTRYRGQPSSLEFQIETPSGFQTLTQRGSRATQSLIQQHLKLDYETFINSAYLRQGRADEFMLKRPAERKQVLADLLNLDQYDRLSEQAKERSRQVRAEMEVLERGLEQIQQQLLQSDHLATERLTLETTLEQLTQQQQAHTAQVQALHIQQQQRQLGQQELQRHHHQAQQLQQDCQQLQQQLTTLQTQERSLQTILSQSDAIAQGYAHLQALQAQDVTLTQTFHTYQTLTAEHQQLQQQHQTAIAALQDQHHQVEAQLTSLVQQEQEMQQVLSKAGEIGDALERLRLARQQLQQLDRLQVQVAPLIQRRQQLQSQWERAQAHLQARLDAFNHQIQQLQLQEQRQPNLTQSAAELSTQLHYLEERRLYQQQVRDKGLERRNFMERLQADQRIYETQLAELDQKIQWLKRQAGPWLNDRSLNPSIEEELRSLQVDAQEAGRQACHDQGTPYQLEVADYPPCPLCDRPLDEQHGRVVLERHQADQAAILKRLWVVREQLSASEREIQVLRQEYRDLDYELANYGAMLERRGRLQEQLQGVVTVKTQLQELIAERDALARSLESGGYAAEWQEEWQEIDHTLSQLQYDDKNHALARGQVDRWRWAELRQAEIHSAQQRQIQLAQQRPLLEARRAQIDHDLQQHHQSLLYQQLQEVSDRLLQLGYDAPAHAAVKDAIRQNQGWQLRYQDLHQAQQQLPQIQQQRQQIEAEWQERSHRLQDVQQQIAQLSQQLDSTPDATEAIALLEYQLTEGRSQRDQHLAHLGRLQQQQQQLDDLINQRDRQQTEVQTLRRQYRVYQELAQACGKNGIQALMIENILPHLEAETNQLLGRLSAHQLHVQFITQRASKRSKRHAKLIDTLDILISDLQGTRPYETYSGGEAFRVNFAIRLALSRLLAQQSGTPLQMLIIDEGFGTQDAAGCERLVAAIQAIADDFACILAVTHMPHLKAAFQTRIEVQKQAQGSQIQLVL